MELFIVYDGGQREHYTSEKLFRYLNALRSGQNINDAAAQTIASWWHTPDEPLTTLLSTRGLVDARMTRETFANATDYLGADEDDRRALDALGDYLAAKRATAESGSRLCACRDCFEIVYGISGAVCGECDDAGCQYQDDCSRDDAYAVDSHCPVCGEPIDFCQGHGQIGDPVGHAVMEAHDNGNHSDCVIDCE